MSEDRISKVANIINEWNPLGEEANKTEDLDGYRIEAMDIISSSKILSKTQGVKESIEKVLTQAFRIKLDEAKLIEASNKIESILSEKQSIQEKYNNFINQTNNRLVELLSLEYNTNQHIKNQLSRLLASYKGVSTKNMNKELLWSWNSDNPEINNLQLPLSNNIEKIIAILLLTVMFTIMVIFIAPILGAWATYLFIVTYALLIPYTLKNYKNYSKPLEKNYINIYNNKISINYYGYNANYELENIYLNSLKVKPIIVGTIMGITWSKALCFKTISPKINIKVPLPVLEPSQTKLINTIKVLTNSSS